MSGFVVLDVVIGLVLVYLVFSLFCATIQEWVSRVTALRARTLRDGIEQLLQDANTEGLADKLNNHPLIKGLWDVNKRFGVGAMSNPSQFRLRRSYPSYIPNRTFALALLDILQNPAQSYAPNAVNARASRGVRVSSSGRVSTATQAALDAPVPPEARAPAPPVRIEEPRGTIALPKSVLSDPLFRSLLNDVQDDIHQARDRVEHWFDDSMERVSGQYKRHAQIWLVGISLFVSLAFNLDTIHFAKRLYSDRAMRDALVGQAAAVRNSADGKIDAVNTQKEMKALELSKLPIGWQCTDFNDCRARYEPSWGAFAGVLMTTLALSLGAPFWFDALNKLVNIRQTGTPPDEKKKR